jgi:hypothetical protein
MANREDKRTPVQRVIDSVDIDKLTGCWNWILSKTESGYGTITYKSKYYRAHRFSYMTFVGEIQEGMIVLHSCDNPACVNPEHLSIGTNLDNSRDMVKKGRQRKTVSDIDVERIRRDMRPSRIACKEYGIKKSQFNAIRCGTRRCEI